MGNKVKGNKRKETESGLNTTCLSLKPHFFAMLEYILKSWRAEGRKEISASLFFREMIYREYQRILKKERTK